MPVTVKADAETAGTIKVNAKFNTEQGIKSTSFIKKQEIPKTIRQEAVFFRANDMEERGAEPAGSAKFSLDRAISSKYNDKVRDAITH